MTWDEVLEALERDVAQVASAVDNHADVSISEWVPPDDLGPLPEHLAPRLQQMLDQIQHLRAQVERRLGDLRTQLADLDRRRDAGSAYLANQRHSTT